MSQECFFDEIITKFLLNTCRLHPQLSRHAEESVCRCAWLVTQPPDPNNVTEAVYVPLTTGSVAEFYIEPMLPHVGDIDVMTYRSDLLAIPRGHPPPTQLPAEFSNFVQVSEIVDSHLPCYVYLELRYLLTKHANDDRYSYSVYNRELYLSNSYNAENHGPAMYTDMSHSQLLSIDFVRCMRCLSWPSQAAHWPTRHKNYSWPDSATVDRVVNIGCDLVGVPHRQCRQHKLMGECQWRLSFSRAEIVLINSWMPVQQIVYHMLRVFMKLELSANSGNNSKACILSNYHIKTLMMWACELKSITFWTDNLNLIRICVELFRDLSVWLLDARYPHYFINNCNLLIIDSFFDGEVIISQLQSIDQVLLSTWFINNYIRQCSKLCPDHISNLFSDISHHTKLQNAVSAIVDWRLNTVLQEMLTVLRAAEFNITYIVSHSTLTVRSCICLMTEFLKTTYIHFTGFFTAVAFLHVAYKISRTGFTNKLMDILATVGGHSDGILRHHCQCSSELSLSKATKLMKVVANSSHSTMQLIEIELSKAYLYTALRCKDSDSDSIYCLANVYLAVLYYITGQYQTAIDHCTLVMRSQDHSQCSSRVVQGELLPKIDDDIDTVLGLAVFHQYVRTAALNQRQTLFLSASQEIGWKEHPDITYFILGGTLNLNSVNKLVNDKHNMSASLLQRSLHTMCISDACQTCRLYQVIKLINLHIISATRSCS